MAIEKVEGITPRASDPGRRTMRGCAPGLSKGRRQDPRFQDVPRTATDHLQNFDHL